MTGPLVSIRSVRDQIRAVRDQIHDSESDGKSMDPISMLQPRRKVTGISAVLLPFTESGAVDWVGFEAHVARTAGAGLTPAVNMDTGYVNLIDHTVQDEVLRRTQAIVAGGPFVRSEEHTSELQSH